MCVCVRGGMWGGVCACAWRALVMFSLHCLAFDIYILLKLVVHYEYRSLCVFIFLIIFVRLIRVLYVLLLTDLFQKFVHYTWVFIVILFSVLFLICFEVWTLK